MPVSESCVLIESGSVRGWKTDKILTRVLYLWSFRVGRGRGGGEWKRTRIEVRRPTPARSNATDGRGVVQETGLRVHESF